MVIVGLILLAGAFVTAFAADTPLVGAWQLDSEQSSQVALYLFTPTRYGMVLAATNRPDIADTGKATAGAFADSARPGEGAREPGLRGGAMTALFRQRLD